MNCPESVEQVQPPSSSSMLPCSKRQNVSLSCWKLSSEAGQVQLKGNSPTEKAVRQKLCLTGAAQRQRRHLLANKHLLKGCETLNILCIQATFCPRLSRLFVSARQVIVVENPRTSEWNSSSRELGLEKRDRTSLSERSVNFIVEMARTAIWGSLGEYS